MLVEHAIDLALFYLIICYITILFKETKTGWNISSKYLLYTASATTFVFAGAFIGFLTILVYIIFSLIIAVIGLPFLRLLIERRRRRRTSS
jgi:Flp pilus assembly protein TadB